MNIKKAAVEAAISQSHTKLMTNVVSYIGLGSNLEQPAQQLVNAIEAIKQLPQTNFIANSSFYLSKALTLNGETAPDYLNAVVAIETKIDPLSLLDSLQAIEFAQGRVRTDERWASRPLDLDILLYGDEIISSERLTVPHAEITKRDFVLVPLAEIAPDLEMPGLGKASQYMTSCQQTILEKLAP